MDCLLCNHKANLFYSEKGKTYFKCANCNLIFINPANLPTPLEEENRYLEHNNDVEDIRYQNFVKPIVNEVLTYFSKNHVGLDYGSGTAPVITSMLRKLNYNIQTFDPFFDNNPEVLKTTYNYIACCEVAEHFHQPYTEFKKLFNLLKPNGKLILKTQLFNANLEFKNWWYKNDQTHVVFYQIETFKWIKNHFNFKHLVIKDSLILLSK
ncbi:MAG TPA: class I SAM-dependent methyltransferase [Flavobacteriaceae bacterium]|nr:class I SAM-dependent methyltransferase [Flavobacteriaceae bacterium]